MLVGHLHQLLGHPGEIRLDELDLGQRVFAMGVEPGRDQQHVGTEIVQRRQDAALERLAEVGAAVAAD